MNENELSDLARSLHQRFGKRFHSEKEAMSVIGPIWIDNPGIAIAVMFDLAVGGAGKKKSHVSAKVGSDDIRVAFGYHRRK